MHTDAFVEKVREIGRKLGIQAEVIQGTDLQDKGFGGIYGVGQAAVHPPALAVLSHRPPGAEETICWVGKGIVYDTGGLSIKTKVGLSPCAPHLPPVLYCLTLRLYYLTL